MNGYIISIAYTKMKEETQDHIINSQMKEKHICGRPKRRILLYNIGN